MAETIIDVGGARLWTATSERGGTPIVLCHGGPGLSDNLAPVSGMIDNLATVHRYDQRGGGRSSRERPFSVGRFVEDLEMLRRHWGHKRWVVGGHSWGGWLSLLYALEHADRVEGVVTTGTPPLGSEWRPAYQAERESRLRLDERIFLREIAR